MKPTADSKFTIPIAPEDRAIFKNDDKVVVVSIFGKSDRQSMGCKASPFDVMCGRQIFQTQNPPLLDKETMSLIEGYYDKSSHVVYLHLRSPLDNFHFLESFDYVPDRENKRAFQPIYADFRYRFARALVFLFSVSHIMILSNPKGKLISSYLQTFRLIENLRQKGAPYLAELLREVSGISKEWVAQGRPCTPRLLFFVENAPVGMMEHQNEHTENNSNDFQHSPIKNYERNLEDQFYRILRKTRVITNSSSNSLFAIPSNQEFVHCQLETPQSRDLPAALVNSIVNFCQGTDAASEPLSVLTTEPEHCFKKFIQPHLDVAFSKGFEDSVGRHVPCATFELPTAAVWMKVCKVAYKFFMQDATDVKLIQLMSQMHSSFNYSMRFSEARCKKVLPLATAAYQDSLPAHYTKAYHEGRLAHAVSVLVQHARGPLCQQYIEQLQQECERHWKSGHQMCEVLSLTGNPCTNPLHRAIEEEEPCREALARDRAPTMPHSSGVRYVSACDCGRKQGPREDPFVLRTANCDFYAALAIDCCEHLEHRLFPVFQPSVKDFRAARLFAIVPEMLSSRRESLRGDTGGTTTLATQGNTQQGLSLGAFLSGQSGGSEIGTEDATRLCANTLPPKEEVNFPDGHQEIVIRVTDTDRESSREKGLVRQPSTTEYLPGMPHMETPPGLLPQFPSWSLVCLGPSSLYSHNHGLTEQPGFLPGTGYLLPWDVTVRLEPSEHAASSTDTRWPVLGESAAVAAQLRSSKPSNMRSRKSKIGKDLSEFVVKIFIGTEYECPRGHRFMCCAPDRVLKATGNGLVKETGVRVAGSDMPLYFPCPCRNAKPLIAQLIRIHVVTPKAPVHVTLSPKVQPAPGPCPTFVPGLQEPMRLSQSAYWVLRLPYIYVGEHGTFTAPKEHVPLNYGRLLAGVYGISELLGR